VIGIRILVVAFLCSSLAAGCARHKPLTLMPTPVIYDDEVLEPFSGLASPLQAPETSVFYATTRQLRNSDGQTRYGNGVDDVLHLGAAKVLIGEPDSSWDDVVRLSMNSTPDSAVPLSVDEMAYWDSLDHRSRAPIDWDGATHSRFTSEIEKELAHHKNREILVYVHGTATNFEHGVAMTGEIDHFSGRDFVGVAFLWPSHRNIFYYLLREDVRRARHSSEALADLLVLLAEQTTAQRINVVSWSAGGRVVSKAMQELRSRHPELDRKTLRERFRLGAVVFAAADVETGRFLERLPAVSELSEQVVVTLSDADNALRSAERFMGGTARIGSSGAEAAELTFAEAHHLKNVELIDVSRSKDVRGFDIDGHHYWYRNPWSSSDLILLLRTLLPPSERGLAPAPRQHLWYLDPGYPERARTASRRALADSWGKPVRHANER
jgi:esterase/lipase superfamily enzyme